MMAIYRRIASLGGGRCAAIAAALLCLAVILAGCGPRTAVPSLGDDPELDRMIGQMIMVGFRGLKAEEDAPVVRDIARLNLGGVILFDRDVRLGKNRRNIASAEQVKRLTATLQNLSPTKLLIAADVEGGRVSRLKPEYGFAPIPSAAAMGRSGTDRTAQVGNGVGKVLASLGINLNFAPVLDVNVNPKNPVIGGLDRSFGADPDHVAAHGLAYMRGMQQHGVLACAKHFPGHGSAWNDSHKGLTDVTATWTRQELIPFAQAIRSGRCDMIMTGHLFNRRLDPDYPATLSKKTITGLLRNTLGFDGVVISDDMQMGAITKQFGLERAVELAVNAGVDILLFGNNIEYEPGIGRRVHAVLRRLVSEKQIPRERIKASYQRIMRMKQKRL